MRLKDKVVIVTGGASGIGRAICELFAEEGAKVAVVDIDSVEGKNTVQYINSEKGDSFFIKADVSDANDVEIAVKEVINKYSGVDILVSNAAQFIFGKVEDVTQDDWTKVFGVNVLGLANFTKYCLPEMKKRGGGSIVATASISSFKAQPAFVPYNTSKGALLQMVRCLALDLAEHNIRVNCVCPGSIKTPASERHRIFDKISVEEFERTSSEESMLKRIGKPIEVAYGALFLASDESSFVTGTPLMIDGGANGI
tara:strand:+ start:147 stop:911 length:765 start_codon:yes stop_codon:yes gene_type:complete